jgi:hypothetical protein
MGWGGKLARDREKCRDLVHKVINFKSLKNKRNFFISCGIISFSRRILLYGTSEFVTEVSEGIDLLILVPAISFCAAHFEGEF